MESQESQNLRKRLYKNLSQLPLRHNFLLEVQKKYSKSPQNILKPKIIQDSIDQSKKIGNSFISLSPTLFPKSKQIGEKKIVKPKKVQVDKLTKQAQNIIEDGKGKIKANLKPDQIFSFYDTFPEMIQDFFYLNRVSHPYDYQIISYAKRNPHQYMTISSQGVTLYHDKEAQFLTREEWLDDQKTYYKLQKIDFFNKYKLSKNFMIWKSKMKRHYMKSMSNILCEKLFLTHEHPRKCLKQIREISNGLEQNLPLFPSQHFEPLSWQQLLQISSRHHLNNIQPKISKLQNKIITSLSEAIELEIKNFKEINKIKIQGLNTQEENKQGYVYSQEAILRKKYKRIMKFVKLAESLLLQSKLKLVQKWLSHLLQKLIEVRQNNLKDDWITINFVALPPQKNTSQIGWSPSQQNFVSTFTVIINNAIKYICQRHAKIMSNEIFQKYRHGEQQVLSKDDRHNSLKNLIEQSQFYTKLIPQIQSRMKQEYQYVIKEKEELKKFAQIYQKHKQMTSLQNIIQESSAVEISSLARQWKNDNQQMQDLPDRWCGMIKFDYSQIRKSMMNVANDSYVGMFSILPLHLSRMCQETEKKVSGLLRPILAISIQGNFVQFTKAVKKASQQLQSIMQLDKQVKQLLMLLQQNKTSNIESHRSIVKNISSLIINLKSKVNEAQAFQNQRLMKYKKQIEGTIRKIKNNVKEYAAKLEQIQEDQRELGADAIMEKINVILPIIAELDSQASNITTIEMQLNLPQTDLNESHNLCKRVQMINNLWHQKKLWEEFKIGLYSTHYCKLDCEACIQKWEVFNNETNIIQEHLDGNEFYHELVEEIKEIENLIQVVISLQNRKLTEKAWNQISEYLAFELQKNQVGESVSTGFRPFSNPKDQCYTLQWLKSNQICKYRQKIQFIAKKSQKQSQLVNILGVLKNYVNSFTLQFVTKKREVTLLGDNQRVFHELEQHLSCLLEILNQEYSDNFMREAKSLSKHYQYILQILQAYQQFGRNFQKYVQLFDPSKHHSKQLSKQAKDFSNLQASWKKIIKNITLETWPKKMADQSIGLNPSRNTLKSIYKTYALWEQIRKGVEEFLDRRRNVFHHYFYFNNDELLALVTNSEITINSIVPIIYENVKAITLNQDSDILLSVTNIDGEQLKITKNVTMKIGSEMEQILKSCEEQWRKSLVLTIKKVISDFVSCNDDEVSRKKIILQNISQVVLAFDYIIWVKLAEQTYLCSDPLGSLQDWINIQNCQIAQLYEILTSMETNHKKMVQLLIQAIYLRDKTQHFEKLNCRSLDSYQWERTLKLCDGVGSSHEKIYLKTFAVVVPYGGELLSPASVFITAETERNYLHIVQCLSSRQIAIIENKSSNTHTLRNLSFLVAQNFKSFNFCSGVSLRMIDRVLAGVCWQGLWACFSLPNNQEMISFMMAQILQIERCIQENNWSIQFNKYLSTINQSNLPVFFIKVSKTQQQKYQKISKLKFRQISLVVPNIKKILCIESEINGKSSQVGQIVSTFTEYCNKLLTDNIYDQFSLEFGSTVLKQFIKRGYQNGAKSTKRITDIIQTMLMPRIRLQDQNLLMNLIQSCNIQNQKKKFKTKRFLTNQDLTSSNMLLNHLDDQFNFGYTIVRDATTLNEIINQHWTTRNKKIAVVGQRCHGKTTIINYLKSYHQLKQKKTINIHRIYFSAFRNTELLSVNQKHQGIIAKCLQTQGENWIIFDGPVSDKYIQVLWRLSNQSIISNYGVSYEGQSRAKLRIFLQTTDLSQVNPSFITEHSVLYLQQKSSRIEQIIRSTFTNFCYHTYQQQTRTQLKNDEIHHEIKTYRMRVKQVNISKQIKELIINQVSGLIEKFVSNGVFKIKSVELMYVVSAAELAYRCGKLIQSVLKVNTEYFRERDRNTKKIAQKFALWVVVWCIFALVRPEDKEKFQKGIAEVIKSNAADDILQLIVYPDNGFELFSLHSPRVQNIFSCVPIYGDILNVINRYNGLFQMQNSKTKNKYEHQFYFQDPHSIRVVTRQSVLLSYFINLHKYSKMPFVIYGPVNSGKKSLVQIFTKRNEEKIRNYSMRFKKYEPYSIGNQIQKYLVRVDMKGKSYLKSCDNSKLVHISIDDVALIPEVQPAIEYLRMISDNNAVYDEKGNLVHFREFLLTMTVQQIKKQNYEKIDFKRFLSKMLIIQNSKISKEKLFSIFYPILDNFCCDFETTNESQEKVKVFTNKNGDNILIEATLSIYSFVEGLINELPCTSILQRNKKLLLTPKITDISNSIAYICQLQNTQSLQVESCAQLWSHEILRVFGDKMPSEEHQVALVSEIKKYAFMHFKYNVGMGSGFLFTNLCGSRQNEHDEKMYIKCDDLGKIQKQIQAIYQTTNLTFAAPIITDELLIELMKVYRVMRIQSCHLLMATPYKKSGKYLIKLANFLLQQSVYHDIEHGVLDFDLHIAPSILKDIIVFIAFDMQKASQETLYTLSCLLNRNNCELEIRQQTRDKIKEKFVTICQESFNKENDNLRESLRGSLLGRSRGFNQVLGDNIKIGEIQNKIQEELGSIIVDCFHEHLHVVTCVLPHSSLTTKFLNENMSIVKHMQVIWYQFKDETLFSTGERMLQQIYQDRKQNPGQFLQKCKIVYNSMPIFRKNQADFLRYLSSCNHTYQIANQQLTQLIRIYEQCINSLNKNRANIEAKKKNIEDIQIKIEEVVRGQEELSYKMKDIEEGGGEEGMQQLEIEMKKMKNEKELLELKSREIRTGVKVCEDLEKFLPDFEVLKEQFNKLREVKDKLEQYAIVVEAALHYLNNTDKSQYLQEFNKWMMALNLQPIESISELLMIFEHTIGVEYVRVPGWQKFSQFTQVKGIHFCQNFISIPQSVFGSQPIIIKDPLCLASNLLSSFGDKNPSLNLYSSCKLIKRIASKKQPSTSSESSHLNMRQQIFTIVEKQIEKYINESRNQLREINQGDERNLFCKGIVVLGEYGGWRASRNDVDVFERKLVKEKKIRVQNRVIVEGDANPNIAFDIEVEDLKWILLEHSMRIQFGDGFISENSKLQTFLRQIAIKLQRKKQDLLIACTSVLQSNQKNFEGIIKIQNEILEIEKAQKKAQGLIPEQYREPNDGFLVMWYCEFLKERKIIQLDRVVQLYQVIKRKFGEINSSKQVKFRKIQDIDLDVIQNWQMLIRANILYGEGMTLAELSNHCYILGKTSNIIVVPNQLGVEEQLKKLQNSSLYSVHFIDMHISSIPQIFSLDQQTKNMFVLHNFVVSSQHLQAFIEHYEKYSNIYCPVSIIISDDWLGFANNPLLIPKFRILPKKLEHIEKKDNYFFDLLNLNLEQESQLKQKKIRFQQTLECFFKDENADGQKIVNKEKIRKLVVILMGMAAKKGRKLWGEPVSLKVIQSRIKLISRVEQVKSFLEDCIPNLPHQWQLLLHYIEGTPDNENQQADNQIDKIFSEYEKLIRGPGLISADIESKNKQNQFIPNLKIEEINDRISRLPFSFNCNDFTETNEPFSIELIRKAQLFNKQRDFLKKYLQQCAKIVTGKKINYWSFEHEFGLLLPTISFINRINSEYKILKKGLEMAGLIINVDPSTRDIRLGNNSIGLNQTQSVVSVACLAYDCRNLEGINQKLLLTAMIKASKKLKVSLNKLRISWKLISPEVTIQENVNGDVCLAMNSLVSKQQLLSIQRAKLPKQSKAVKLLMMIYDPTPLQSLTQPATKQLQLKKEKSKKGKQERVQSVSFEGQTQMYPVPIKQGNGKWIGVVSVPLHDEHLKYRAVVEQPQFILF